MGAHAQRPGRCVKSSFCCAIVVPTIPSQEFDGAHSFHLNAGLGSHDEDDLIGLLTTSSWQGINAGLNTATCQLLGLTNLQVADLLDALRCFLRNLELDASGCDSLHLLSFDLYSYRAVPRH